jgi:hypothetical protein
LDGCKNALHKKQIDYLFISTHSQELHNVVALVHKTKNRRNAPIRSEHLGNWIAFWHPEMRHSV